MAYDFETEADNANFRDRLDDQTLQALAGAVSERAILLFEDM